jgi:STAM-binding protein
MRYATLVADKLSQHPSARDPEGRKVLKAAQRAIPNVIDRLESLKPRIEKRYAVWEATAARRDQASTAWSAEQASRGARTSFDLDLAQGDPAIAGNTTTLAAADHGDLAVKLAHKEIRRRDAARKATRQAGISEEEEQERRTAGLWDDWDSEFPNRGKPRADEDIQRQMQDTRRRVDGPYDAMDRKRLSKVNRTSTRPAPSQTASDYRYPSIAKSQPLQYEHHSSDLIRSTRELLPPRPAKEHINDSEIYGSYETAGPPRPDKRPQSSETNTYVSPPSPVEETSSFTFRPSAYLENGSPLRTVFLPPTLRQRFLDVAALNTRANLETCGILCGTLISNALFISRLVIPEQESTSDTCETVNESALFDFCDSEDLMVLGWIHTHPSQTCFMSSRDLHTHCGYQVMMPESIAIVCAPSKDPSYVAPNIISSCDQANRSCNYSWGVFRLTDPPGMKSVLNCQQTGLFHPHPESNIYTDALRPGHVFEANGLEFEVVDLRPKK